jgi:enamine deaminase RidA (YjgF/YER057c/UK114 family)
MQHQYIDPPELFSTKGFGFTHIVRSAPGATIHISLLEAFFAGGPPPASTWLGVSALAVPGFLVEVEATAVVAA